MLKDERKALEMEIKEVLSKSGLLNDNYLYFDDEELLILRKALQPGVDGWNDGESEYQHMVDLFGGGIEEYNYDEYISNIHERKLIEKINKMTVSTYMYFMPVETMEKIDICYVEHKTGARLEPNYDRGVIVINK